MASSSESNSGVALPQKDASAAFVGGWLELELKNPQYLSRSEYSHQISETDPQESAMEISLRAYMACQKALAGANHMKSPTEALLLQASALVLRGLLLASWRNYRDSDETVSDDTSKALIQEASAESNLPEVTVEYLESMAIETGPKAAFIQMARLAIADRLADPHGHRVVVMPGIDGPYRAWPDARALD